MTRSRRTRRARPAISTARSPSANAAPPNSAGRIGTRNMPSKKPAKPKPARIRNILVAAGRRRITPTTIATRHAQRRRRHSRVAAEEAVAVFRSRCSLVKFSPTFATASPLALVDRGRAALHLHPGRGSRPRPAAAPPMPPAASLPVAFSVSVPSASSKLSSPRTASDSAAAVKARHFSRAEAPIVDVVGERRRNALGRIEQRDDGAALRDRGRPRSRRRGNSRAPARSRSRRKSSGGCRGTRTRAASSALGGSTAPAGISATTVRPSPGAEPPRGRDRRACRAPPIAPRQSVPRAPTRPV